MALNKPDFTTATRVAQSINTGFMDQVARTQDSGTIHVAVPPGYFGNIARLIATIEGLNVAPDSVSRVVINERTGTKAIAPEAYDNLQAHHSWSRLLFRFLFDRELSLWSRVVRSERGRVRLNDEVRPDAELIERTPEPRA